jgi:hypothetical protein
VGFVLRYKTILAGYLPARIVFIILIFVRPMDPVITCDVPEAGRSACY